MNVYIWKFNSINIDQQIVISHANSENEAIENISHENIDIALLCRKTVPGVYYENDRFVEIINHD